MATRVRAAGRFMVGSDSDSDLGGVESYPHKRQTSVARGMTSNRVSKPVSKRAGSISRNAPRPQSPQRRALTDKSNFNATRPTHHEKAKPTQYLDDDTFEDDMALVGQQPSQVRKKQRLEDSRPVKPSSVDVVGRFASSSPPPASRHHHHAPSVAEEVYSDDVDMMDTVPARVPTEVEEPRVRRAAALPARTRTRPTSSSGAADREKSVLEQRLREMTRRYENLEGRYTELREVGVKSAERNYERLRKQSEENTSNANKLIAKLKEELAAQRQSSGTVESIRHQLEDSEANNESLLSKVEKLSKSLSESERQINALNAKLAASRAAPGSAIPSSAVKGGAAKAWTGQSELVHAAHAKEDLYADLTGLIVQGVKQNGDEDIFDCIQAGRNCTLHFKLGIPSTSTVRYEDSTIRYFPQLQPDRDADVIGRLPEYLRDELGFKRSMVAAFYAKVVRALKEPAADS